MAPCLEGDVISIPLKGTDLDLDNNRPGHWRGKGHLPNACLSPFGCKQHFKPTLTACYSYKGKYTFLTLNSLIAILIKLLHSTFYSKMKSISCILTKNLTCPCDQSHSEYSIPAPQYIQTHTNTHRKIAKV